MTTRWTTVGGLLRCVTKHDGWYAWRDVHPDSDSPEIRAIIERENERAVLRKEEM